MGLKKLPADLPARLRAAGLKVVVIDGWETRGVRDANFVGVLNHHTGASAKGWDAAKVLQYVRWMFFTGRPPTVPPPLCNMALAPDGTVYLGVARWANHAGNAKARGTVAAGNGNRLYVGIEWMLSGTEKIPRKMRKAGVTLNAVLLPVLGSSEGTVAAHYETSVTGKWDIGDPDGVPFKNIKVMDMDLFRTDVRKRKAALSKKPGAAATAAKVTGMTMARDRLRKVQERARANGKDGRARKIAKALRILPND